MSDTRPAPAASGVRTEWSGLPAELRAAFESWAGAPVLEARSQRGGFSPGVAARLRLADSRRFFVKAVSAAANPTAPHFHRREATITALLPPSAPAPRLLWSHDASDPGGHVLLAFEDIGGRQPAVPWLTDELQRVSAAVAELGRALTPSPIPIEVAGVAGQGVLRGGYWRRIAALGPGVADPWSARHAGRLAEVEVMAADVASAGDTLVHHDLRADNILLGEDGRTWFVDWPHARIGAPWLDVVLMAPSVAMQGGPPPEDFAGMQEAYRLADPAAVDAVVAAEAGFFTWQAMQPPPPGLPTLRPFQLAQARVAQRWIGARLGLV